VHPQPHRIVIRDLCALPASADLYRASKDRHVVLVFQHAGEPTQLDETIRSAIEMLRNEMPDDVVVFDAGGKEHERWVTVKRVISREQLLPHLPALAHAARAYRDLANDLMRKLTETLRLSDEENKNRILDKRATGQLDREWDYRFHGTECRFTQRKTGQQIEAMLAFDGEFGVLDPYFFYGFLKSTDEFKALADIFPDSFHSPAHAIEMLFESGQLREVRQPSFGNSTRIGYIAR
jgi:hypothetical protein